jgi:hypothetical protein
MLYTPLAVEDIFRDGDPPDRFDWQTVGGRLCLVRIGADGRRRLERLVSTDPQDYLDAAWQPGQRLT